MPPARNRRDRKIVTATLTMAGAVSGACLVAWLWQRFVGRRWLGDATPVVSAVCGAVASSYVITVAFLLVGTNATLVSTRQSLSAEAGAIRDAYMASTDLPAAAGEPLQNGLRDYTRTVLDTEWPLLARGQDSPLAWQRLDAVRARRRVWRPPHRRPKPSRTSTRPSTRSTWTAGRDWRPRTPRSNRCCCTR